MLPNHPITLERVLFTRSVVIALQEHKPIESNKLIHGPINEINVQLMDDQPKHYAVTMRTRVNTESDPVDPYMIDMECIGFFIVDDTLTSDDALRGVTITGHSVLYGAIREAIAWITGRQPHGQLALGLSVLAAKPGATAAPKPAPKPAAKAKAKPKLKPVAKAAEID